MATWKPDPTFYPSARMEGGAPKETVAYVASFDPTRQIPDDIAVVDVDPASADYGNIVQRVTMPNVGDELHHFGWNACSSCLCPNAPHPHSERRYLVVPGCVRRASIFSIRSPIPEARTSCACWSPPKWPRKRAIRARIRSIAVPRGIYVASLANADGEAPGGIFLMDHETFDIRGRWEIDRGPQELAYDAWWHLGYDTLVTSEWGLPATFENGLVPEVLLGGNYGHRLHFWDMNTRKHKQVIDFGAENQLVFELRPAHNPTMAHGFVNSVISLKDLSASIWTWYREGNEWAARKVIEIPAEPADADLLPPMLKGFGAVPPLVTDIALSLDDRYLYVSCWGTGDLRQYDVSDPFHPELTGKVRIGGVAARATHPGADGKPLNGGPQMVEVSRDGKRVYFTNSLYGAIDEQFYPDGLNGWMVKLDAAPDGGLAFEPDFFIQWPQTHRPHQIRLEAATLRPTRTAIRNRRGARAS